MDFTALKPPVRILLQVPVDHFDQLTDSCQPEPPDTKLIQMFCCKFCDEDIAKMQHIFTRISNRGLIVFDYNVSSDDDNPEVSSFRVNLTFDVDPIDLSVKRSKSPRTYVNKLVQGWKTQNTTYNCQFPGRIDLRVEPRRPSDQPFNSICSKS
jgi:hypothetical protein